MALVFNPNADLSKYQNEPWFKKAFAANEIIDDALGPPPMPNMDMTKAAGAADNGILGGFGDLGIADIGQGLFGLAQLYNSSQQLGMQEDYLDFMKEDALANRAFNEREYSNRTRDYNRRLEGNRQSAAAYHNQAGTPNYGDIAGYMEKNRAV